MLLPALARAMAAMAALFAASAALAEDPSHYPGQAVHMVVPFPAGGPADILARALGQRLSDMWRQPVVIENRPGANTAVAAAHVAKAPPDGYTLFVVMDVTMVLNPLVAKDLPYDPLRDFAPITLLAKNTSLLSVRASDGPATLQELIARGRANPGKLNYGAGIITTQLAAALFNREAGIVAQLVPYQGSPPTVMGLMTGSVDYIVDGAASSIPLIQAGKMRALAKLNNGRVEGLPELKSLAEASGIPALEDVSTWIGLVAPAGAAPALIDKLQRDVAAVYASPNFQQTMEKAGINAINSSPGELGQFVRSEQIRWGKVVKDSGLAPN